MMSILAGIITGLFGVTAWEIYCHYSMVRKTQRLNQDILNRTGKHIYEIIDELQEEYPIDQIVCTYYSVSEQREQIVKDK